MKNLILYLFLLISASSYSQKRLELASTFAPDKQLGEVNFYKWKKSGFGYYLGIQAGNYGNRVYDSINRDFLGRRLTTYYKSYSIRHLGFLMGTGVNYNKKINNRFSYRLQLSLMVGYDKDERITQYDEDFSPYYGQTVLRTTYRIQASMQYECSIAMMVSKKIGLNLKAIIPFYFPVTHIFYSDEAVIDAINIGLEPAISIGAFYQLR